jgi:hypothetical protein
MMDKKKGVENMKNCLILGSGRSGTSMIAGILHKAGYFMGDNLYPPRTANPKGFFENWEINEINEKILEKYTKKESPLLHRLNKIVKRLKKVKYLKHVFPHVKTTVYSPGKGQAWLFSLSSRTGIDHTAPHPEIEKRIKAALSRKPFAYKDPRFSYTLPVWAKSLDKGTVLVCIFREPDVTVESILKECRSIDYLEDLKIDREKAYEVWLNMYSHILEKHRPGFRQFDFIFIHYEQVYDGSALNRLSAALGVPLGSDFVDKQLKRTRPAPGERVPQKARQIYSQLCSLAGYNH